MSEWPTRRARYALQVCAVLARHPADELMTRDELADVGLVPRPFLASILSDLRRGGIITAKRGARGGYRLAGPPALIGVASVMHAVHCDVGAPFAVGIPPTMLLPIIDDLRHFLAQRCTEEVGRFTLADLVDAGDTVPAD